MPLERGKLLNKRYRIVEILGQGGMGSVYRAIDENLGVDVAVKENLFTTDEYARQFRREATLLASLRHPNLPRVTDHFEIENRGQYLIMDYIEGEDLRERMDRDGILQEDEVAIVGIAICDALTYLHTRRPQVVHRDIKPGNVKIAPDGRIFLVDFGLAKVVQGSQATTTGARAMTPGYSPPEQYGTARTDHRSDIYSLGATLYAALCGVLPEDGLARAMDQAELTPVRKQNPKVSRRMGVILEKALTIQPDARYQSAEEFKQALLGIANNSLRRSDGELAISPPPNIEENEELDEGVGGVNGSQPVSASDPGSASSLRPISKPSLPQSNAYARSRPQRRRYLGCLLYLVLIFGVIFIGASLAYARIPGFKQQVNGLLGSSAPPQLAGLLLNTTATATNTQRVEVRTDTPEPTPSLTATVSQTPAPSATPTLPPTATATLFAADTALPTSEPAFLGNSNGEIAFASNRSGLPQIWIINVDGVRFRQLTDMPGGACQPDWSPDGLRLVFISPCPERRELYTGAQLWAINGDGTGLTALLGAAAGDYDPAWSPDGSKIAFTSLRQTGTPKIYLLNIDDGEFIPLAVEGSKNMQPAWSPDGSKILFVSTRGMGERLWIMNADGSEQQPLTEPTFIAGYPDWSPDGETAVITTRENIGDLPALELGQLNLSETAFNHAQIKEDDAPRRDAKISPDGQWILFESWPEGTSHDIWIMSLDGEESRELVNWPFYEFSPVWRPFVVVP